MAVLVCGSSPRLRGTVAGLDCSQGDPRFIPAPAGNRPRAAPCYSSSSVHPRACGEQQSPQAFCSLRAGSSPRLRGTGHTEAKNAKNRRFIPAPAGNSPLQAELLRRTPVHPRACGEQAWSSRRLISVSGSSPRLRGTVLPGVAESVGQRFIPAPAGNSGIPCSSFRWLPVHPRACGEQSGPVAQSHGVPGSSPRLRGTARVISAHTAAVRFIPAPAGNRISRGSSSRVKTVHPRACGEQRHPTAAGSRSSGSSPRLRGTERVQSVTSPRSRFIPAPAGNSARGPERIAQAAVHPRACGEQQPPIGGVAGTHGSSPRLRGTELASTSSA